MTAAKHAARTAGAAPATSPPGFNPWRDAIERAHERRMAKLNSAQLRAAERLPDAMVAAAEDHGVSLSLFEAVTDLPTACLDAIAARDRRRTWRTRSFDRLHRSTSR